MRAHMRTLDMGPGSDARFLRLVADKRLDSTVMRLSNSRLSDHFSDISSSPGGDRIRERVIHT